MKVHFSSKHVCHLSSLHGRLVTKWGPGYLVSYPWAGKCLILGPFQLPPPSNFAPIKTLNTLQSPSQTYPLFILPMVGWLEFAKVTKHTRRTKWLRPEKNRPPMHPGLYSFIHARVAHRAWGPGYLGNLIYLPLPFLEKS